MSSLNRTFVELKLKHNIHINNRYAVLIEPLWNWNRHDPRNTGQRRASLNRTFVELKQVKLRAHQGRHHSLNRTFVELKLWGSIHGARIMQPVLIEPLWNWNFVRRRYHAPRNKVLIEPLWNWNWIGSGQNKMKNNSLNRTFVELKLVSLLLELWHLFSLNRTFVELKPDPHFT